MMYKPLNLMGFYGDHQNGMHSIYEYFPHCWYKEISRLEGFCHCVKCREVWNGKGFSVTLLTTFILML